MIPPSIGRGMRSIKTRIEDWILRYKPNLKFKPILHVMIDDLHTKFCEVYERHFICDIRYELPTDEQ